jgi:hypothetical protein
MVIFSLAKRMQRPQACFSQFFPLFVGFDAIEQDG